MEELSAGRFTALASRCHLTLVDVGCGDGAFPYRLAGRYPDLLCLGLDANREAPAAYAAKARRKPARGGRPNVLFVPAALESLPAELAGSADLVTINFPWAGLLDRILGAEPGVLTAIRRLGRDPFALQILINADAPPPSWPGPLTPETLRARLGPPLAGATITLLPATARVASRWGGRLIQGSGRSTLRIRVDVGPCPPQYGAILDATVVAVP